MLQILLEQQSQGPWISFTSLTELKSNFPLNNTTKIERKKLNKTEGFFLMYGCSIIIYEKNLKDFLFYKVDEKFVMLY